MRDSTSEWRASAVPDPDLSTVHLSPDELVARRHELKGLEVYVESSAVLENEDLSGLGCRLLAFRGGSFAGRALRTWRPRPRFVDCDFSSLAVDHLILDGASFLRCDFSNIAAKLHLGTDAVELIECSFSGDLDGNLSRGPRWFGKHPIRGNDFRRLRGVDFHDGVHWQENSFDLGHTQLILDIEDAQKEEVREVFEGTDYGQILTDSLIHHRPLNTGQSWMLLHQDSFTPAEWSILVTLLGHHRIS